MIPPEVLVAEFERQWPREAELTRLRLENEAMRQALATRTRDDIPPHLAEALAEIGHDPGE